MTRTRAFSFLTAAVMMLSATGCGGSKKPESQTNETSNKEIKVFSSLFATTGTPLDENNEIQQLIAEKTGAMCKETWLDEREDVNAVIGDMLVQNAYPDLMYPDAPNYQKLLDAGALVPIDNYWDDYPYLRGFFSESEWNRIRAADGHVYCVPLFSSYYLQDTNPNHTGEAFWIQLKVLKWAGYPKIVTMDDYFDLIERYLAENPTDENGEPNIGYEILANDSMFFSLDNPPMFLDGYPNDGCCIVDPVTHEAIDYNLSPTAEKWFRKLNEEYHKGIIDQSTFMMSSEQYYEKLKTGRVLGIVDQKWNFDSIDRELDPEDSYIPIGAVIKEGIEEHYHSVNEFNASTGAVITKSCTDPEAAVKFLNDLLSPEILLLRFWGIEGVDYSVDKDGVFYITDEQRAAGAEPGYREKHHCMYGYLPYYFGMAPDGINAYCPAYQPDDYYSRLDPAIKECFDAYGAKTYVEMLNKAPENTPWYPMWSFNNGLNDSTPAGQVMGQLDKLKHKYLPQVVMSDDFDATWAEYKEEYGKIDSEVYFNALTDEVARRISLTK